MPTPDVRPGPGQPGERRGEGTGLVGCPTASVPSPAQSAAPNAPSVRPTVYVVVTGRWEGGDVSGALVLPTGEAPFGHTSSSLDWLRRDLTSGFRDRREDLEHRFPDGYDVVVIDKDDELPADVAEANKRWYGAGTAASAEATT